jgi:hypothetical protein
MLYKRLLGCRQAFGIKNKIAKTRANQFFHIFQTERSPCVVEITRQEDVKKLIFNCGENWARKKLVQDALGATVGISGYIWVQN